VLNIGGSESGGGWSVMRQSTLAAIAATSAAPTPEVPRNQADRLRAAMHAGPRPADQELCGDQHHHEPMKKPGDAAIHRFALLSICSHACSLHRETLESSTFGTTPEFAAVRQLPGLRQAACRSFARSG
jgi:hypothetical protein